MVFNPNTKTLLINGWDFYTPDQIMYYLEKFTPNVFILDNTPEWTMVGDLQDVNRLIALNNFVKVNKIKAYCLTGSYRAAHKSDLNHFAKLTNFTIKHYPLYWLKETKKFTHFDTSNLQSTNPEFLFYSHNNRPHLHRCILVDSLVQHNLTDSGRFTWNLLKDDYGLDPSSDYNFQYFEERLIRDVDDPYRHELANQFEKPSLNYFNSLFDIVSESTVDATFFTEKTFKPIVYRKPFIIFGAPNINKDLRKLGFQLFDRVVDYSFDSIPNTQERAQALAKELTRLSKLDYSKIYDELDSSLEYNKRFAYDDHNTYKLANPGELINKFIPNIGNYSFF